MDHREIKEALEVEAARSDEGKVAPMNKEERKAEDLPAQERRMAEPDYGPPQPRSAPRASGHGLKVAHTKSEVSYERAKIGSRLGRWWRRMCGLPVQV